LTQSGDVVMITQPEVLQAWIGRSLTTDQLIESGLIRLYGTREQVAALREALIRAETNKSSS
jgi:hypothetical protein